MKKIITIASLSTLALILTVNSQAEIYKWTDANGTVHYTAQPPVQSKKKIKAKNIEDQIRSAAGRYKAPEKSATEKKDGETGEETKLSGPSKQLLSYCKKQRENLSQLEKNYTNIWIDIKGKKTRLDQKQREEKVKSLRSQIKENCAEVKAEQS